MFDFNSLLQLKILWDKFKSKHQNVTGFINDVSRKGNAEGAMLAVMIAYPDGERFETDIVIDAEDIELLRTIKNLKG